MLWVEVQSTNRAADPVVRAATYAAAGIDHYWVIDTLGETLTACAGVGVAYRLDLVADASEPPPPRVGYGAGEVTVDMSALFR